MPLAGRGGIWPGGPSYGSAAVPVTFAGTAAGMPGLADIDGTVVRGAFTVVVSGVWLVRPRLVGIWLPRGFGLLLVWRLLSVSLFVPH